jgi:enamine deaminase RidA (YjgF/YER057c/UK114 family)
MEQIIQFLEEYWGVSIAGGVTVGTLVTFIVVQVKSILINNQKNTEVNNALKAVNQISEKYNQLEQRYNNLESMNVYLEQVNMTTFKALSYIVVASKLPSEDKIALQTEFAKLSAKPVVDQAIVKVTPIVEQTKDVVQETISTVVQAAGNLLTKYINDKD